MIEQTEGQNAFVFNLWVLGTVLIRDLVAQALLGETLPNLTDRQALDLCDVFRVVFVAIFAVVVIIRRFEFGVLLGSLTTKNLLLLRQMIELSRVQGDLLFPERPSTEVVFLFLRKRAGEVDVSTHQLRPEPFR